MKKVDLSLSAILLVVCGIFYFMISKLPKEASMYPIFVTTILAVLTLIQGVQSYVKKDDEGKNPFNNIEWKQLLFVVVACAIYIALINLIGYFVASAVYVLTVLVGLKVNRKQSVIVSLGFCIFIFVVFKVMLKVPLPKGFII